MLAGTRGQVKDQVDMGRKGRMPAEGEGGAVHEMALERHWADGYIGWRQREWKGLEAVAR